MTLDLIRINKEAAQRAYTKALEAKAWSQGSGGGSHRVDRQDIDKLLKALEYWDNLESQYLGKMRRIKVGTPIY